MDDYYSGQNKFDRHFQKNHSAIATHQASIERLFNMFNKRVAREVVDSWSQELQRYDHNTVEEAVKFMFKTQKFCPAFQELKDKCQEISPKPSEIQKKAAEEVAKYAAEQDKFKALKEVYIKACEQKGVNPNEALAALVKKWFMARYGTYYELEKWGLTLSIFEMCALFDLEKAKRLNRNFEDVAKEN